MSTTLVPLKVIALYWHREEWPTTPAVKAIPSLKKTDAWSYPRGFSSMDLRMQLELGGVYGFPDDSTVQPESSITTLIFLSLKYISSPNLKPKLLSCCTESFRPDSTLCHPPAQTHWLLAALSSSQTPAHSPKPLHPKEEPVAAWLRSAECLWLPPSYNTKKFPALCNVSSYFYLSSPGGV